MKKLFTLSCLSFIFLSSCTKELASTQDVPTNASLNEQALIMPNSMVSVDTSKGWYGQYSGSFGPYPTYSDSVIIGNGVAQLPNISQSFDFTNIAYEIPSTHTISGDSLIFEAVVKNPKATSFYDYDVILQVYGDKNMAQVQFVADASSMSYDQFFVGGAVNKAIPNLIYDFESFTTVRLVLKRNDAGVFVNNKLMYAFNYGSSNQIGKVTKINIAGKGFVVCDKVTLSNSYSRKPILSEDFNVDGQSHTIYY